MSKSDIEALIKDENPAKIMSSEKYMCSTCGKQFEERDGFWYKTVDDAIRFFCDTDYYYEILRENN